MSTALSAASRLKPDIRLAQAISEFVADLSTEQKTAFNNYRSQACTTPPGPGDVMRLTAELDHQIFAKGDSKHCYGPRITSFLQAIQQFAVLGDVLVGSSQNLIAAGVWSLVRLTILVIAGQLRFLSEYFIIVVHLCHRLLKLARKSAIKQFTSTQSSSDLVKFQPGLELWANTIKEEVNLQMAKTIEDEAKEESWFRNLSRQHLESKIIHRRIKTRLEVLDECSQYDHVTAWKQIRKAGNAKLFRQVANYEAWKDGGSSCTLICTGMLGCGKSVLLANIVDDLNLHLRNKNATITYFFCRHDIPESLSARTILGSLARQLLESVSEISQAVSLFGTTPSDEGIVKMRELIQLNHSIDNRVHFILDGLDECTHVEQNLLLAQLRELQTTFPFLLCVSRRLEPGYALDLHSAWFLNTMTLSMTDDNPDIEAFVSTELADCVISEKLILGDPSLVLEIQNALLEGSQGMFLWVVLQIESLCMMQTDDEIRSALTDLPKDLSEIFMRILRQSEKFGASYQKRILQLITIAQRPLTIEELREALSVVPGDASWDPARLLNNMCRTLRCCGCLLTTDEEELTVRLVHHSVKQFVLSGSGDSVCIPFTVEAAQVEMARTVITYICYGVFESQLCSLRVPQLASAVAPSTIVRSALSPTLGSIASRLLDSRKLPSTDIGKILAATSGQLKYRSISKFHFLSYAQKHWLDHFSIISEQDPIVVKLLPRFFSQSLVDVNQKDPRGHTALMVAAYMGKEFLVTQLLETNKIDINLRDSFGNTALSMAAIRGSESVVRALLSRTDIDVNAKGFGGTPLSYAAWHGHAGVVKQLLDTEKADLNSRTDSSQFIPLDSAVIKGHELVLQHLLAADGVQVNLKDTFLIALKAENDAVVRTFIEPAKADILWKDHDVRSLVSDAARSGDASLFRAILSPYSVFERADDDDATESMISAGHEALAKMVNSSFDQDQNTLLLLAARQGSQDVVEKLLSFNATDVNARDSQGRTPLWHAVAIGHLGITKLLLARHDIDVECEDDESVTPLSYAAKWGTDLMVKLLLRKGKANPNRVDKMGHTPIKDAATSGRATVVRLLRAARSYKSGANGTGLNENVVEAYNFLCLNYEGKLKPGSMTELSKEESDEIFLFGFSRGAYTVRALVGLISAVGILKKSKLKDFGKLYALYQESKTTELNEEIKPEDVKIPKGSVKIRIVGVWDTVGSLGVPDAWFTGFGIHKWMNKDYEFHDPDLAPCVQNAFQALALDEHRRPFSPTLWHLKRSLLGKPDTPNLVQCWFPGVHINIGGGSTDETNEDTAAFTDRGELSDITFAWMVDLCRPFLDFEENDLKEHFIKRHTTKLGELKEDAIKINRINRGGYAQGMINDPFEGMMAAAGSRTRAPGQYNRKNQIMAENTQFAEVAQEYVTNEYIHPSARIRITKRFKNVEGKVWDRATDQIALAGFQMTYKDSADEKCSGVTWVKAKTENGPAIRIPEYQMPGIRDDQRGGFSAELSLLRDADCKNELEMILTPASQPFADLPDAPKESYASGMLTTAYKTVLGGILPASWHWWENDR
ncbi:MAG: hypothetical protein M1822_006220 [Bathelium mastoideum]|nr:MAG: hypothetical protein M1822_006220 [Bathelium mastoideum]